VINNNDLEQKNNAKVNWDNESISKGPWIDTKLFIFGSHYVTPKDLFISSSVIIAIILSISCLTFLIISYCRRKAISEAARRMIFLIVQKSFWLSKSLRRFTVSQS